MTIVCSFSPPSSEEGILLLLLLLFFFSFAVLLLLQIMASMTIVLPCGRKRRVGYRMIYSIVYYKYTIIYYNIRQCKHSILYYTILCTLLYCTILSYTILHYYITISCTIVGRRYTVDRPRFSTAGARRHVSCQAVVCVPS